MSTHMRNREFHGFATPKVKSEKAREPSSRDPLGIRDSMFEAEDLSPGSQTSGAVTHRGDLERSGSAPVWDSSLVPVPANKVTHTQTHTPTHKITHAHTHTHTHKIHTQTHTFAYACSI